MPSSQDNAAVFHYLDIAPGEAPGIEVSDEFVILDDTSPWDQLEQILVEQNEYFATTVRNLSLANSRIADQVESDPAECG